MQYDKGLVMVVGIRKSNDCQLSMSYPMENGEIENFASLTQVLEH